MLSKIVFFFWSILIISSCTNKKCKEAEDTARTKSKDANLMYIWRYTDDLIKNNNGKDSGFYSFKPNGDFNIASITKEINTWAEVWQSNNNIIATTYCSDQAPMENNPAYKYLLSGDTLFLYPYSSSVKGFSLTPKTFIHYKKY